MKCPCGSGSDYKSCCEPYHTGEDNPPTAEKLMRARYSAYVVKTYDYLQETLDPQTSHDFDPAGTKEWGDTVQFTKLEIIHAEEVKNKAVVEFIAYFNQDGTEHTHHEVSKFRQQGGVWYFREGKVKPPPKEP